MAREPNRRRHFSIEVEIIGRGRLGYYVTAATPAGAISRALTRVTRPSYREAVRAVHVVREEPT